MSGERYSVEAGSVRGDVETLWRTDWLGTNSVFYNMRTRRVSHLINDVIDPDHLEFDPEGFNVYLSFGYCALGLTPFKDVFFLPPCSELRMTGGDCAVVRLPDPADILTKGLPPTNEEEVLGMIQDRVWAWEQSVAGEIVIPTSGGFDSRLLNLCVHDRSRIRSFTYGASLHQTESREVVVARKLSEILGTRWEHVELLHIHRHLDAWFKLFGCATHAHGMYQIAFYERVREQLPRSSAPMLSGIIGDAWAGAVRCPPVTCATEVPRLGYTHGLNADVRFTELRSGSTACEKYFEGNRRLLASEEGRIVLAMRSKMMLLRYLFEVPASLGVAPWSPFLDAEVALAMLRLPIERRKDRIWQREYFQREGVDIETMGVGGSVEIELNRAAVNEDPLKPLSEKLLSFCVDSAYVRWINRRVCGSRESRVMHAAALRARNGLLEVPYLNAALYRCGFREKKDDFNSAYFAYMTLWPIQRLLSANHTREEA